VSKAAQFLSEPSVFGLEAMAELDIGLADEVDIVCVFRHGVTGLWYAAGDAGVDIEPFAHVPGKDLVAVFTIDDVAEFASGWWIDQPDDKLAQAVETLTTLVRDAWRKRGSR